VSDARRKCVTAAVLAGALALAGCGTPVGYEGSIDDVESICGDFRELADDMYYSDDPASREWLRPIDELGVRAATLDTIPGDALMEAIAQVSVGLDDYDLDFATEGLDKVRRVCDREDGR
jgi:hypothetical protein